MSCRGAESAIESSAGVSAGILRAIPELHFKNYSGATLAATLLSFLATILSTRNSP